MHPKGCALAPAAASAFLNDRASKSGAVGLNCGFASRTNAVRLFQSCRVTRFQVGIHLGDTTFCECSDYSVSRYLFTIAVHVLKYPMTPFGDSIKLPAGLYS